MGVELPDGSAATVPAVVTDVFGAVAVQEQGLVLDADGLRGLRALVTRLLEGARPGEGGAPASSPGSRPGPGTRK